MIPFSIHAEFSFPMHLANLEDAPLISSRDSRETPTWKTSAFERIYFVHIRKTAGSSLNHMFLSLGGEDSMPIYRALSRSYAVQRNGRIFVGWHKPFIEQGNYYYAFSHEPFHALQLPEETFVFTCFRDPVSRVLSLYNMLYRLKTEGIDHPCMAEQGPWLGNSFEDFLELTPRTHLLNQLYTFSASLDVNEALTRMKSLSFYFRMESFNEGVQGLNSMLGINLQPTHKKKAPYKAEIANESLQRLRNLLEPEYRFLSSLQWNNPG